MHPEMVLYQMSTWDHVVAAIICILAPVLAYTSRNISIEEVRLESEEKIRLYHSNALLLLVFALVTVTTWRLTGRPIGGIGIQWPQWDAYIPVLLAGIFIFYVSDLYFRYGTKRRREATLSDGAKAFAFIPSNNKELAHFIFLAVAAGIGEEIIFRGYLINYFIYWTGNDPDGVIYACIGTSALFAFLHGYQGIQSMAKIFFLSLMFSALFVLTRSLLIVVAVHAVIDIISGIISVYLKKQMENTD